MNTAEYQASSQADRGFAKIDLFFLRPETAPRVAVCCAASRLAAGDMACIDGDLPTDPGDRIDPIDPIDRTSPGVCLPREEKRPLEPGPLPPSE